MAARGSMGIIMERRIAILIDARMTPDQVGLLIREKAEDSVQDLIMRGLGTPNYDRFVDGGASTPVENVRIDGGMIEYVWERGGDAARYCYEYCRSLSPGYPAAGTGHFASSWIVVIDGEVWDGDLEDLPAASRETIITNFAPFARRLEQTTGRNHPRYQITETAARATKARFRGLSVKRVFVAIPGPADGPWPVPWVRQRPPREPVLYPAVQIEAV